MCNERPDEDARRAYWTKRLEEAHEFVEKMTRFPVDECGQGLTALPQAVKQSGVEVTFSDRPHAEGRPRMWYLRSGLIDDFIAVAQEMNKAQWVLHVEDAYRTRDMQRGLWRVDYTFDVVLKRLRWELGGRNPDAEFMNRRFSTLCAPTPKVGTHTSGSALDISVYRRGGGEVDRGGPYLEMSELTPMESPFISTEAAENRRKITDIFERRGFVPYPYEFWHYSKGDAYETYFNNPGDSARYGAIDFDPDTGKVRPLENPTEPLSSLEDVRQMIAQALARSGDE